MPSVCKAEGLLFDLDGTLIDSVAGLSQACQLMCERLGLPQPDEGEVRCWVGDGADRLIKRALTRSMEDEPELGVFEQGRRAFLNAYDACCAETAIPYAGVESTLETLKSRGLPLAVVTNKPAIFTVKILQALNWVQHFSMIVGGDSCPQKKPHPQPLLEVARHWQKPTEVLAMVGDSKNDVIAGKAAGMTTICVPYGYNHGMSIEESAPDYIIHQFNELPQLLAL